MLEHSQIRAGEWLGVYLSDEEPALEVVHLDAVIEGLRVTPAEPGKWRLSLPIPAATLSDGVQTYLLRTPGTAEVQGRFVIIAGAALDHDLQAEVALLRAELDLLKSAFRRHCTEG